MEFEPGRYLVTSETAPDVEYLVDLNHDGGPMCGCRGWEVRKKCHHVELAKMFDAMLAVSHDLIAEAPEGCQCGHCVFVRGEAEKIRKALE